MSNKFVGFLKKVGQDIEKVFSSQLVQDVEREAAVLAGVFFPGLGPAFNLTANAVINAERNFAAVGKSQGTGPQKLASVLQTSGGLIQNLLSGVMGKPATADEVASYINAAVAVLNSIPAENGGIVATVPAPNLVDAVQPSPTGPAPVAG